MEGVNTVMKTLFLILSQGWLEIAVAVGLVLLLRLCLRPFPKYLTCLLWLGVLFRLLCPFSLPKAASPLPAIPAPVIPLSSALTGSPQPAPAAGSFDWLGLLSLLWLAGLAFFLLKGLLSLLSLKKRLKGAQKLCDNIYVSSRIPTPFVFGIFRPAILLPAHTPEAMRPFVIAHEKSHIARLDHVFKPLFYLAACIYWFHPLVWVAFFLFAQDMEMACDEKTIRSFSPEEKKDYSFSLLALSAPGRAVFPPAFGQVSPQKRIRRVLSFRKPAAWILTLLTAGILILCLFFLFSPRSSPSAQAEDGRYLAFLSQPDPAASSLSLDKAQWITDTDTQEMEKAGITPEDMPGGFYLHNPETQWESVSVSPQVTCTYLDPAGNFESRECEDFSQFAQLFESQDYFQASPYWITVQQGSVTQIQQQYVP